MQATVRPTRLTAPAQGRPQLELVHFPLYSSVALDAAAAPRTIQFFTYAIGQVVAGTGTGAIAATRFHTNMQTANFLAAPKTFTVEGVRIVVPGAVYTASPAIQATAGVAIAANPQGDDLQLLVGSGHFRFFVGPKDYVQSPLFAVPANTGLGGVSSTSISNTNAASVFQRRTIIHTSGRTWAMPTWPVLIANQQSFGAELLFQWATNPTVSQNRLVFCVLDGVLGREVS